jgi:hypothetical protein
MEIKENVYENSSLGSHIRGSDVTIYEMPHEKIRHGETIICRLIHRGFIYAIVVIQLYVYNTEMIYWPIIRKHRCIYAHTRARTHMYIQHNCQWIKVEVGDAYHVLYVLDNFAREAEQSLESWLSLPYA